MNKIQPTAEVSAAMTFGCHRYCMHSEKIGPEKTSVFVQFVGYFFQQLDDLKVDHPAVVRSCILSLLSVAQG